MPTVLLSTDVRELLAEARRRTLALVQGVSDEDLDRVHDPLMSPLVWDLGHTWMVCCGRSLSSRTRDVPRRHDRQPVRGRARGVPRPAARPDAARRPAADRHRPRQGPQRPEAAYNDSQGVTAEFNRNVLRVVNDGLGANFAPEAFEHVAFFDEANSWIEMRLRANGARSVRIEGADLELTFEDGEEIRTEISAKFTQDAVTSELVSAGLELESFFTDDHGLFGLAVARHARP